MFVAFGYQLEEEICSFLINRKIADFIDDETVVLIEVFHSFLKIIFKMGSFQLLD